MSKCLHAENILKIWLKQSERVKHWEAPVFSEQPWQTRFSFEHCLKLQMCPTSAFHSVMCTFYQPVDGSKNKGKYFVETV